MFLFLDIYAIFRIFIFLMNMYYIGIYTIGYMDCEHNFGLYVRIYNSGISPYVQKLFIL